MNQVPLVSVICLCHNHERFVEKAIRSVWSQTHPNIELIVVDDGSIDNSKRVIAEALDGTTTTYISFDECVGNCKAFNAGFHRSRGEFIIDLAADDFLLPDRISKGLKTFNENNIGVEFCNVLNIDEVGNPIASHFKNGDPVPEGDVYSELIKRYLISPPGMMIKREVLEKLNGYDESLSYEDFDFWIRSARDYRYGYTNSVLVHKRILPNSLSKRQFKFRSVHQKSTLKVCQKIKELNRTREEDLALRERCFYEIRQCIRQGNFGLVPGFIKLITSTRT